jgi:hypothetical protein
MQRRFFMSAAAPAAPGTASAMKLRADTDTKHYQFTIPRNAWFNQLSKRSRRTLLSACKGPIHPEGEKRNERLR